jgi:hypothetical protein
MRSTWLSVLVVLSALTLTGCELAANIFQAGVWVGVVAIVFVIAIVAFIASKMRS